MGAANFCLGQVVHKNVAFCPVFLWYDSFADSIMVLQTLIIINAMLLWLNYQYNISLHVFKAWFQYLFTCSAWAAITINFTLTLFIFGLVCIEIFFIFFTGCILKLNLQVHPPCTIDILSSNLNSFTHSIRLRYWVSGSLLEESTWCHYIMVEADSHLKLLPQSILDIYISIWTHWYAAHRHTVAALHSYPPYLAQILGFWVTYGVEMMSLRHGWGWQPPQTASCIYIRYIQTVWEHWYAVHMQMVAALHSYPPNLAQIGGLWVLP